MASLESSLARVAQDPLYRTLLRQADLEGVAHDLARRDPFGETGRLQQAITQADLHGTVEEWLFHRLWCAQRAAPDAPELQVSMTGPQHLEQTMDRPTVIVAPMTTAMGDALTSIGALAGDRPVIVYGEGVTRADVPDEDIGVAPSTSPADHISGTLNNRGVYCTYADFVYEGRSAVPARLLGHPRPMSRGFVRLASRPDVILLPTVILRTGLESVTVDFAEPVQLDIDDAVDPVQVAQVLCELLEDRIQLAGPQWLLLPTLTFEAAQLASAAAGTAARSGDRWG